MSLSRASLEARASNPTESADLPPSVADVPPVDHDGGTMGTRRAFWCNRLIECGLILSMALYYVIGNQNLKFPIGGLEQLSPWFGLPFLAIFIVLCWSRLSFAVALLPLALPYYLAPKDVIHMAGFSPAEIVLWICVAVAVLQLLLERQHWPYRLSLPQLRQRIGPFLWPIAIFLLAALISLIGASSHRDALRALRQEIIDPLLYVVLILCCLRSRQELARMLGALFASGLIIAFMAIVQYAMFGKNNTVYGSDPSVGLLFDYTLPIGLAIVFSRLSWKIRLPILLLCIPFVYALLHNDSRGSAIAAFPVVLVFLIIFAIRNRKVLLIGGAITIVLAAAGYGVMHQKVDQVFMDTVINGHMDQNHVTTLQRRIHLWQSAEAMIHDQPLFGYGLDNWICHYADPRVVPSADPNFVKDGGLKAPQYSWMLSCPLASHYYIVSEVNGETTHMYDEPGLSHPHNNFLHVWVSIGIFGLLAFIAFLVLFCWLCAHILRYLSSRVVDQGEHWRWMTLGAAAAMLAGFIQGLVDCSFLAQDLAFCFWLLVATLLVIRAQIGLPWSNPLRLKH
ncbi:O-antigen ligase family protein [Dictyobacter aurantiacus]|nr:O-antigen ligase family protein [Dictyobacter aurantiacus]